MLANDGAAMSPVPEAVEEAGCELEQYAPQHKVPRGAGKNRYVRYLVVSEHFTLKRVDGHAKRAASAYTALGVA